MLEELLGKKIDEAIRGRQFWQELLSKYQIKKHDYVILLPSDDKNYNYYTLLYLERFLNKKNAGRAVVLSVTKYWADLAKDFTPLISDSILINSYEADCLLSFYCLYEFSDHLIIGSLKEPEGRLGEGILGKHNLTVEDVIKVTLYDIVD
jgi:hypothetical protein